MMRAAPVALLLVAAAASSVGAQAVPAVRRVTPKAFPLSVTPNAGFGFGNTRAASPDYDYGAGSGWQVGLDLQVPIASTIGFELAGEFGHPSRRRCQRGACETSGKMWAYRGTATLLWRFKARAPIYFGVGGAVTRFSRNPVLLLDNAVLEVGGTTVVGIDFRVSRRVGGRVMWRSYFLAPDAEGLPTDFTARSIAWDNAILFGLRVPLRP